MKVSEVTADVVVIAGSGIAIVATIVAVMVEWVSGRAPGTSTHIP